MLPYPENIIKILKIPSDNQKLQLTEDQEKGLVFVLNKFSEFEQTVFWCHYKELLSYAEIAKRYGRTKERVLSVHRKVIQRLRSEKWKPFYNDGYNKVLEKRRLEEEKRNADVDAKIERIERQSGLILSAVQITDLLFPVRINNAFKHANISTLDDLIRLLLKDQKKAWRINGLGKKSWEMILDCLDYNGIHYFLNCKQ